MEEITWEAFGLLVLTLEPLGLPKLAHGWFFGLPIVAHEKVAHVAFGLAHFGSHDDPWLVPWLLAYPAE
jgi:hypothetical protein